MRLTTTLRSLATAAALFACAQAHAAFHLFTVNEVYSNSSGTLQFVEMTALAGGQQFTAGHTLVAIDVSGPKTFTLGLNLPGDTSQRRVLFGTSGIAAAFGVTPDYIIPNNFLGQNGGTVNWGEGSSTLDYPALPTDGTNSYSRGGTIAAATPQNFAGVIGHLVDGPATYQALWWASPAASESGWGVNVTHQGDIIFATWFTYDADGNPMWIILSRGDRTPGTQSFTGDLFRTTGPVFSSVPFTPSNVVATKVGTATFTFTSPTAGTFAYTLNGISQTKSIVRQEFSTPVPNCTAGGAAGTTPNYQALWWLEAESGWGMNIIHQGDIIFATWFTYDATGKGMWVILSRGDRTPGTQTFTGDLFRTRGNPFNSVPFVPSTVVPTKVGTATIAFSDAEHGSFNYTLDGVTQTKPITKQGFATPLSVCK
ncbi:hypothetical protein BWI17_14975 [Betaproteobacteria bacterium GR16-43]|nr:hypothetical protein BWI17_14975 [Betaproteobacteria bacterium GR16-43]